MEKSHYSRQFNELEIDSETLCEFRYCIKTGKLSMYCEDIQGDATFAKVKLKEIPLLIEELQGIYETYVEDVRMMKYLKD